jgi:primosomal protein N''
VQDRRWLRDFREVDIESQKIEKHSSKKVQEEWFEVALLLCVKDKRLKLQQLNEIQF